jgi:UDP-N-acetylmuramate dehydrogenase
VRFALPKAWQPVLTYPDLAKHPQLASASQAVTAQASPTATAQAVTAQASPTATAQAVTAQASPTATARPVSAQAVLDAVCDIRRRKLPDPAVLGNAGSFFKNPVVSAAQHVALQARFAQLVSYPQQGGGFKLAAGWLIEYCGFKGLRAGAVGVHAQQALVLVNYGGAQADELLALAHSIIQAVQKTFDVLLEIEPVIV